MINGQTAIYGFQCHGWSSTWDHTENAGTPSKPIQEWIHSKATCKPSNWGIDTWHLEQVSDFRNDSGNVTYNSVRLDGIQQQINVTVPSAGSDTIDNLTNRRVGDRAKSKLYLDDLIITRW
jgi:hypothetical protein